MKKIYLIITSLFLICCSKENDIVVDDNLIKSYHMWYMMDYPSLSLIYPNPDDLLIKLEYSNNKISKRIGDVHVINISSGYGASFANYIYDEVSYRGNKIIIEKKSSDFNIDPYVRTIELNKDGTMFKKTSYKPVAPGVLTRIDTITTDYFYDSKKLLIKTYSTKKINYSHNDNNLRYYEDALFYYNENRNLDSIVTTRYRLNDFSDNDFVFSQKVVEAFGGYDANKNITKNLNIFEETFIRSLSNNNFRTYRKDTYYGTPLRLSASEGRTWNYIYDSEGNIRFDKY